MIQIAIAPIPDGAVLTITGCGGWAAFEMTTGQAAAGRAYFSAALAQFL